MKNTVVLVDANVILDFLLKREPGFEGAMRFIEACSNGSFDAYMALHSVSIISYVLRKLPAEIQKRYLRTICGIFSIASIGTEEVREAIEMDRVFSDPEDRIQYKCAQSVQAEYIITRNIKDFANSEIAIRTPEEICEGLSFN